MTAEELYAMEAETGRTSEWEPLYRAEKRRADVAEAAVARVRALHADRTEYLSARRDPRHVPLTQQVCRHCGVRYPCTTIQALDAP